MRPATKDQRKEDGLFIVNVNTQAMCCCLYMEVETDSAAAVLHH